MMIYQIDIVTRRKIGYIRYNGLRYSTSVFILLLIFLVTNTSIAAQLDTIVVTGTRSERTLLDVPVRTEVISQEEIKRTHSRDLGEALRYTPGVLLKDVHGKSGKEVWLQGMNSERVLVLIDGRPVSASTGSTVDLSQISTSNIDHVEIVKGAVSSLYGSSAMGGVVNVITRQNKQPLSVQLQLDTGSYGEYSLNENSGLDSRHINTGFSVNRSTLSGQIDFDIRDNDGFDLNSDTVTFEGDRGSKTNLSGNLQLNLLANSSIKFETSFYKEDLDRDFTTFAPGVGEIIKLDLEVAERFNQTLSFKHESTHGIRVSGYAMHEEFVDETRQDVISTAAVDQLRHAELGMDKIELQIAVPQGDAFNWTVGGVWFNADLSQYQKRDIGGTTRLIDEITPGAEHQTIELFVQNEIFSGDNWEWVPGVRYQDDSQFGHHVAPKINALFTPQWLSHMNPRLRFGLGSGYRIPNLKERFFLFDHSANGYIVIGNSALLPEESLNAQMALELSLNQSMQAEVSTFINRFDHLITTSLDPVASEQQQLQVFNYSNIDQARTVGVETRFNWQIDNTTHFNVAYSWLDSKDLNTDKELVRTPHHQWQLGIDWPAWQRTTLSVRATWQSKEFVNADNDIISPSFAKFDLKLNHTLRNNKRFNLFAGIDNVTDQHRNPDRSGSDFRPKEGRYIYTGLRYSF